MMRWDFWRRKRHEIDLDDEIAYDLALDAEERIRSGVTRQEAEQASRPEVQAAAGLVLATAAVAAIVLWRRRR